MIESEKIKLERWVVNGEEFEVDSKYQLLEFLGSGAYGVVCSANDKTTNEMVAIKKCKSIFKSRTLAKRTLREVRILRHLHHANVCSFHLP
jgi:serine/threonine protein kinase